MLFDFTKLQPTFYNNCRLNHRPTLEKLLADYLGRDDVQLFLYAAYDAEAHPVTRSVLHSAPQSEEQLEEQAEKSSSPPPAPSKTQTLAEVAQELGIPLHLEG